MTEVPEVDMKKELTLIFIAAIKAGTSDIHIVPEHKKIYVKFRVDGKFVNYKIMAIENLELLIRKLKIIGNLKTEENRLPQDGSFTITVENKEIFIRASLFPTLYGEKAVLRILSTENEDITATKLWIHKFHEQKIEKYIKRKNGLILIVWPTGSGKSTTIVSILKQFDPEKYNITTLEDPIEYRINGVTHSQINHRIGFDFAVWLRSILRQDPDIVMVWEIRDMETAKLSMEAAITGHLVLSTLHANSGTNSVQRLISLNVDSNMIISGLKLVISQQLIRRLCPHCKKKYFPTPEVLSEIQSTIGRIVSIKWELHLFAEDENGCEKCNYTGFKGRIGIYEVFELTKAIKKLILEKQSENLVEEQAMKEGMVSLRQDGIIRVVEGDISLAELNESIGDM